MSAIKSGDVIRTQEVYCPRDFYVDYCRDIPIDGTFYFVFKGGRCIQVVKSGEEIYSQEIQRL